MSARCKVCKKLIEPFEARQFDGMHVDCYLEEREGIELDPLLVEQSFNHNLNGGNSGQYRKANGTRKQKSV